MSSEIIDFYQKANEDKEQTPVLEVVKKEVVKEGVAASIDDPFGGFLLGLAEKINQKKAVNKPDKPIIIEKKQSVEIKKEDDPLSSLLLNIAGTIKESKAKKIKDGALSFIKQLGNEEEEEEEKEEVKGKEEPVVVSEPEPEVKIVIPKQKNKQATNIDYVEQLEAVESIIPDKVSVIPNTKDITVEQVRKEMQQLKTQISRMEGGGGSVAVQYANGGVMNGDLNVTGRYLSAGVDLGTLIQSGGGYDLQSEIESLSSILYSTKTTVQSNSAEWESAYLDTVVLNQQVSNIQSNIIILDDSVTNVTNVANSNNTLLNSNSANWNSTYTTVQSNSANWNYQGTDIKSLTGNWDLTYNTVANNSSNWNSAYNKVNNLTIADVSNLQSSLTGKQDKGNYPVLDNENKIPSVYLPSYVDDIVEYSSFSALPSTGESSKIYTTLNDSKIYRWSGTQYVEIVASIGSTDSLVEGSVNKYFTNSRAASAAPVQSVAGRTGNIVLGINDITNLNTQLTATNVTTSTFQVKAVSQGIYNDGTTIPVGTSLETIIRNMLITRVFPTYNAPLLSVAYGSPSISTTYEVGFTIPTFTINPTYTPRDGGSLVGYAYLRNGSTLGNGSTFTVNSFQINSTTTLQVSARYGDGPIYNDNLGDPYPDTSIKANSVINTLTINTLYPYFYGKSSTQPTAASIAASIQAGTATKVLADANGTVSIGYNANGEFIWFAHIGTTKTKWYFTELNSGNIGNGNFINTPVPQNVTSPENYWTSVQYKIYISSGQTSTTGALQFRNS